MFTRRALLGAAIAAPLLPTLTTGVAMAAEPAVFATDGVAINGYDPVAYFTQSMPVQGSAQITASHDGATFRFASEGNKAMFLAEPAKFAPQYGGYCAYAVSKGYTATTSPNAWTVHDGKLYLNFNRAVRGIWSRDIPGNVKKGDANWPSVLSA
ncbi:YHS domain-containing (seleno)protein [Nereida sp. MMG025]|uniref:YHS domain-containing (seleno)protein n=1 Tax=Nereida sp. MMG025 TaxID=2909981 RepID=UPI001F418C27|nr:YHS domain-containing (seleno)protein [Nereida sp. MMG025]MCF6445201.1 YHS domain protein [Nereida sp. MMG025]